MSCSHRFSVGGVPYYNSSLYPRNPEGADKRNLKFKVFWSLRERETNLVCSCKGEGGNSAPGKLQDYRRQLGPRPDSWEGERMGRTVVLNLSNAVTP